LMHWVECIFPHPSCTDIIPLSRWKQVETFFFWLTSVEEMLKLNPTLIQ
jgi:hypothetical protein